jgi:phage host-nuclease inhibitor protein Gam
MTTQVPSPQASGVSAPDAPPSIAEGTRLLRRIAEHRAAIQRVEQDAEAQLAEIIDWRASEVRQHQHEVAVLEARLQPCVDAEMARNPLKRESVKFPSGTAGYRAPRPRAVVGDPVALITWALHHRPHWLRTKPPEPDLETIKAEAIVGDDGSVRIAGDVAGEIEVVPGIRVERGDRTFYAKPGAKA